MNDGDDYVTSPSTNTTNYSSGGGGGGHVYFMGDTGADTMWGGTGDDPLDDCIGRDNVNGESGNDFLNGKLGNDTLIDDLGNDRLIRGTGKDFLTVGTGGYRNTFQFSQGDSDSSAVGADVTTDWNVQYDYIDSSIAGTSAYYREGATGARSIATACSILECNAVLREADHNHASHPKNVVVNLSNCRALPSRSIDFRPIDNFYEARAKS